MPCPPWDHCEGPAKFQTSPWGWPKPSFGLHQCSGFPSAQFCFLPLRFTGVDFRNICLTCCLVSYSPWDHKESDMTEQPTHIQAAKPGASQAAQWVKNLPAMQETQEAWVQSLGQEHLPEEGMATHSSSLAWRIPRTEEPG